MSFSVHLLFFALLSHICRNCFLRRDVLPDQRFCPGLPRVSEPAHEENRGKGRSRDTEADLASNTVLRSFSFTLPSNFKLHFISIFCISHILIRTFSLSFSLNTALTLRCFLQVLSHILMPLCLLLSCCLFGSSGAGRQRMCHKDDGVAQR